MERSLVREFLLTREQDGHPLMVDCCGSLELTHLTRVGNLELTHPTTDDVALGPARGSENPEPKTILTRAAAWPS